MSASTFVLVLVGVLLNAAAQLLLKAGVMSIGPIGFVGMGWMAKLGEALVQPPVVAGLACYVASVLVWIAALSRVEVSLAYPMLSLGYVVNAIAAWYLFGEAMGPMRLAGIALVLAGVFVISRT